MKIMTFGCRLNTFESALIHKTGADLPDNVLVVNTCAVTGEAERQCRQAIRKAYRENPDLRIYVVGCAAQLHPEEYAAMPEVVRVLGNRDKLIPEILLGDEKMAVSDVAEPMLDVPVIADCEGRERAFLQIQQGCGHACTFCIVRQARGPNQGLHPDKVLAQARAFVAAGFKELVITGVDLTSYPYGFTEIIERLLTEVDGLERLRLGSLDPACLDEKFVALMGRYPKLMPHLHLSIQAGDNLVLKRMGRRHTFEDVVRFAKAVRGVRPDVVLGADFITGFPTETEEQFQRTMDLVHEAGLTHLHVFPYSARTGTPAAKMPMVDMAVRKERAKRLRVLGDEKYQSLLDGMIGKRLHVLIEKKGGGWSENYLKVQTNCDKINAIVSVLITERKQNELVGQVETRNA